MIGTTLGHYEFLELRGRGGMGEVYRARDAKLDREVALKLVPAELARDAERAARFQREAPLPTRILDLPPTVLHVAAVPRHGRSLAAFATEPRPTTPPLRYVASWAPGKSAGR